MDLHGLDWERVKGLEFARDLAAVFTEERRVLKPGHWAPTWAHPKTSHWTAVALELAGFEIVTKIVHLNAEAKSPSPGKLLAPGHEEWILARTPGPPVPLDLRLWHIERHPRTVIIGNGFDRSIDRVIGARKSGAFSGKRSPSKPENAWSLMRAGGGTPESDTPREASVGGASRYFPREEDLLLVYAARCRRKHRELYPDGPESAHPTPKSLSLIVALLDLVVGAIPEPRGFVLDPYAGSGSTGAAAVILGLDFVGIDRDPQWLAEQRQRLAYWSGEDPALAHMG